MSQADLTLRYRQFILGVALVTLSGVWVGDIVTNTVQAQSVTLLSEQLNSTRTEVASPLESSGSLIIASQSKAQEKTVANSTQLAATTTATTTTTQEDSGEVVSDSMIKPHRPNGLLYKDGTQEAAQKATTTATNSTSLVEGVESEEERKLSEIVIYFSAPEDVRGQDVDSLTGASLITKDVELQGITEYVAHYIGQRQEIPVFKLTLEEAYPSEHNALIERSYVELRQIKGQSITAQYKISPEVDLSKVERIFLGFPLWWNDLPLPVYAFLKQEDLSGKTILPFCTYGHNTPYQLFKRLIELEPNAKIIRGIDLNKQRLVKGMLDKSLERWVDDNVFKDSSSTKSNSSTTSIGTNTMSANTTNGTNNNSIKVRGSGNGSTAQVSSQSK